MPTQVPFLSTASSCFSSLPHSRWEVRCSLHVGPASVKDHGGCRPGSLRFKSVLTGAEA